VSYTREAAVRLVTEALHTGLVTLERVETTILPAGTVVKARLHDGTVVHVYVEIEPAPAPVLRVCAHGNAVWFGHECGLCETDAEGNQP
jgi:hypothetical protein